jgi:hypothetical protein
MCATSHKAVGTGSQSAGSTCAFNFTGTPIRVVTTVRRAGPFSPQLDGVSFMNGLTDFSGGNYSYHDDTFLADNLSNSEHPLLINATNIWLAYFLYTASSKTNLTNAMLFTDDRDPSLCFDGG